MATLNIARAGRLLKNAAGALVGYISGDDSEVQWVSSGLLAARPAASVYNVGAVYFATDVDGGTGYTNLNGASWTTTHVGISAEIAYTATTWALRGSGSFVGQIKRITDLGNKTTVLAIWDGTYWQPLGGAQTIYALAAPITGSAGTSSACTLPSITVPAGLLNINAGLDIEVATHTLSAVASVANTVSYTFGGFELFGTDRTTNRRIWNARRVMNRNSASVQTVMSNASGTGAYEVAANDPKETTKDSTAAIAMAGTATATHASSITNRVDEFRVRWIGG